MTVTVLLVDDQERFRHVARAVVARIPTFRLVAEAADGEHAVRLAAELSPDLVLMDIHLPGIDGIEATRRIVDARADSVVVLLSSYDRDDLPSGAMDTGARAYLHKEELSPSALGRLWDELAGVSGD
jgi:two-component system invasion response regulator UvrY